MSGAYGFGSEPSALALLRTRILLRPADPKILWVAVAGVAGTYPFWLSHGVLAGEVGPGTEFGIVLALSSVAWLPWGSRVWPQVVLAGWVGAGTIAASLASH